MLSQALELGDDFLQTLGSPPPVLEPIVSLAVFLTAVGIIWKAPVIRRPAAYVGHRLVGDPVTTWFRHLLSEEATRVINKELKQPNAGGSIADLSAQLSDVGNRMVAEAGYAHSEIHRLNGLVSTMWAGWAREHGINPSVLPDPQPSPKEDP